MPINDCVLSVKNLNVQYGPVRAVRSVSFAVARGEIVAILGANGAGKSSIIRAVAGAAPRAGNIEFPKGREIQKWAIHRIRRAGLSWVPEGRDVFTTLTVHENLQLGAFAIRNHGVIEKRIQVIYEMFPKLSERRKHRGDELSGGEQQMLAIGRALVQDPELLLLDEPSLGLAPKVVQAVFDTIEAVRRSGVSVLVVEQNANQVLRVADRALVLSQGEIQFTGSSEELKGSKQLRHAYLGE